MAPWLALRRRHDEGGGLAPAGVAASGLRRVQRGDEPTGQRAARLLERPRHRRPHLGGGHHVRLRAELVAGLVAGVRDAARTGVDGDVAMGVDDGDLPEARELIGSEELVQRLAGARTVRQPVQRPGPVRRLRDRLRADRADSGANPRDDRPDSEPVRLDRRPELPGRRIPRDDRVRATPNHPPPPYLIVLC